MLGFLHSCTNQLSLNSTATIKAHKSMARSQTHIRRSSRADELNQQPSAAAKASRKRVSFQEAGEKNEQQPDGSIMCDAGRVVNDEKARLKVKIVMTREDAARLLSKCKNGGVLEFKDVVTELVKVPSRQVNIV